MTYSDDLLFRVLDELPVTDTVYHDLAYTRPLTTHLLDAVTGTGDRGRTLLVGPNIALAQALSQRGWPVEIWHVPGVAITEDMRVHVTRVADLESLFGEEGGDDTFDVIVLPFVLDAARADPSDLLKAVRRFTRPDGRVIITTRRAGALESRMRALVGRSTLTVDTNLRHSWSWPSSTPRRRLDTADLRAAAGTAGFRLASSEAVLDVTATAGVDALTVTSWLGAHVAHAIKRAVPALRDTLVATLTPLPEVGGGTGLPKDYPTVSVIIVGRDRERARRVARGLEGQTYPADRLDVRIAAPDARSANIALRESGAEVVAFTDDLSHQPAGWIESGVRALSNCKAAVAGGVLVGEGSAHPFLAMPDRQVHAGGRGLYLVANSFYVRDAALAVGGFDESVGHAWGWDTTAALRLRDAGFPTADDDTTIVFRSYPFPADRGWMREEFERCRDLPSAVRRDPTLRRQVLDHYVFASSRTRCFDLAVLGALLGAARRKPAYVLLLAIPWVRSIVKYIDFWPPRQWRTSVRNLRGMVLRNVIWLAGLVWGSLRSRRLVL